MKRKPINFVIFLIHILRPYYLRLSVLLSFSFFWALHLSIVPYSIKMIIDIISQDPQKISNLQIYFPVSLFVCTIVGLFLFQRLYDWTIAQTIPKLKKDIWNKIVANLMERSARFFRENPTENLCSRLNGMTESIIQVLTLTTDLFFAHLLAVIIACFTLWFIHLEFALVLIVWSILFFAFTLLLLKRAHFYSTEFNRTKIDLIEKTYDIFSNMLNVKIFSCHKFEMTNIQQALNKTKEEEQKFHSYALKIKAFQGFSCTTLLLIMLGFLIRGRLHGYISAGDVALVLGLSSTIIDTVWQLASELLRYSSELGVCSEAFFSLMHDHDDFAQTQNTKKAEIKEGSIVFENVTFSYDNSNYLFKNKNLNLQPKTKIGLIGLSGSGKTTFVNLILRQFKILSGQIYIDGHNIIELAENTLFEHISFVPQHPVLFNRSIIENIRYGNLNSTEEEIYDIAKSLDCHHFILQLENGYETIVGKNGIKLSGGQRQRICLARAILKNAPILILDEPTSALDFSTENKIHQYLASFMKNKTTIIITHRFSILRELDRVLVFKDGKIIEDGPPNHILKGNNYYFEFDKITI